MNQGNMSFFRVSLISFLLLAAFGGLRPNLAATNGRSTTMPNAASAIIAYWQTVLPHSSMPSAIRDLLTPNNAEANGDNFYLPVSAFYGKEASNLNRPIFHVERTNQDDLPVTAFYGKGTNRNDLPVSAFYGKGTNRNDLPVTAFYGKGTNWNDLPVSAFYGKGTNRDDLPVSAFYGKGTNWDDLPVSAFYGKGRNRDDLPVTAFYRKGTNRDDLPVSAFYGKGTNRDDLPVSAFYGKGTNRDDLPVSAFYGKGTTRDDLPVSAFYGKGANRDDLPDRDDLPVSAFYGKGSNRDDLPVSAFYRKGTTRDDLPVSAFYGKGTNRDDLPVSSFYRKGTNQDDLPVSAFYGKGTDGPVVVSKTNLADDADHHVHEHRHIDGGHNHFDVRNVGFLFLEDDLTPGSKVAPYIDPASSRGAPLLPRAVADSIPMSTKSFTDILRMFAPLSSAMAESTLHSLELCEHPFPIKGETRGCVTSIESMVDFAASTLRTIDLRAFSTSPSVPVEGRNGSKVYTVLAVRAITSLGDTMTCHGIPFPYKVFLCHALVPTKVYAVTVESDDDVDKEKIEEALVVCHHNTAEFDPMKLPRHVKPGDGPVCHFLNNDDILWAPAATTIGTGGAAEEVVVAAQ